MNQKSYFAAEPINLERQMEVDLIKGFAVIFMVWVHTEIVMGDMQTWISEIVANIWGGPFSAPMFMICLGIGVCYSRHRNARYLAIRGLKMLALGALVHLLRFLVSQAVWIALGFIDFSAPNMIALVFFSDILQFAGLAFLFFAVAIKKKWSLGMQMAIAVACSVVGTLLCRVSTGNFYADLFLGYLWGTGDWSCFPLLNWLIFPVTGVGIGKMLLHCFDKKRMYMVLSPISLLLSCIYIGISCWLGINMYSEKADYYFLSIVDAFFVILLAIGLLGQNYLMTIVGKKQRFTTIVRVGKNCNAIFCIHWVLIELLNTARMLFFSGRGLTFVESTAVAIAVLVASDGLARIKVKECFARR